MVRGVLPPGGPGLRRVAGGELMRVLDGIKLGRGVKVVQEKDLVTVPPPARRPMVEHPGDARRREQAEGFAAAQAESRAEAARQAESREVRQQNQAAAAQADWVRIRDELQAQVVVCEQALAELQTGGVDLSSVEAAVASARRLPAVTAAESMTLKAQARVAEHRNPNGIYR
jgi:hypothetical protein